MEKPKKVAHKFHKAILLLLQQAQTMLDHVIDDLSLFTAKFPDMDAAFVADWQAAIDDADDAPDNEQVLDEQQMLTNEVANAMVASRNLYTLLIIYVKLAYPNDLAVLELFGVKRYRKDRNMQLGMKELMEVAYEHANSTTYKATLIAKGFSQANIDALNTLAQQLETTNKVQEKSKSDRYLITQDRSTLLNNVWDFMTKANLVAPAVYPNDYAKQQWFLLYPEKKSGGGAVYEEIVVPAGSTINAGEAPEADNVFEVLREGGTGNIIICTGNVEAAPCGGGFVLAPGASYNGTFSGMGIAGGQFVNITNTGTDDVIVRFRVIA